MFELIVVGGLLVSFAALVGLGLWHRRSASDIWDKDRHRSWETQANVEVGDIKEMMAAQNEIRERRGEPPLTEEEVRRLATAEQRKGLARAKKERRARSRRRAASGR